MGLGYEGYLKLQSVMLLCNTTGLEVQIDPIFSTAVFGSGWYNAAAVTNYADNQLTYSGPIDFDLQGATSTWADVNAWAITNRATPSSLELSPDGSVVYDYTFTALSNFDGAWCSAMSLNAAPDAIVKVSITALAIKRNETFNDLQYFNNMNGVGTPVDPVNPSPHNLNPIPGWNSQAEWVVNGEKMEVFMGMNTAYPITVVDYNFNINNNTQIVRTCNGKRIPTAVLQGTMDVTGSTTLYREGGIKDPVKVSQTDGVTEQSDYINASQTYLGIAIGGTLFIKIPYALIQSSQYGVRGQNEVSTKTYGLKGIGDGVNPPIIFPNSSPIV